MIIAQIKGGLGNQLFQYALGRALSLSNQCRLKLDLGWFEKTRDSLTYRQYKLSNFSIEADIATREEVHSLTPKPGPLLKYRRAAAHHLRFGRPRLIIENKARQFDRAVPGLKAPVYLEGYWQSHMYFEAAEATLRKELGLRADLAAPQAELAARIKGRNAVSVHIRRGDYVSNPAYAKKYGTVTMDYYRNGVSYIAARVKDPLFVVFTDDYPWVKENLHIDFPVVWLDRETEEKDCVDLWLMSRCRHHLIANSSYSWWGAWLADNPDKIVINPWQWKTSERAYNRERSPAAWIPL